MLCPGGRTLAYPFRTQKQAGSEAIRRLPNRFPILLTAYRFPNHRTEMTNSMRSGRPLPNFFSFAAVLIAAIATTFSPWFGLGGTHATAQTPTKPTRHHANTQLSLTTNGDGLPSVLLGDTLVAGFISNSEGKPIIYPLATPMGKKIVRSYPIRDAGANEKKDHPHHRSMWLTHGEVNGEDFWATSEAFQGGTIRQDNITSVKDPETGHVTVTTQNTWLSKSGDPVLSDARRFTFLLDDGRLVLDCGFRLHASAGDVNFGDTKEGSFGVRLAGSMKVDAGNGGKITNAEGRTNAGAWGRKSSWVDYSGPIIEIDTKTAKLRPQAYQEAMAGMTIHVHPDSYNAPGRWHVRDYGLFAANPFGEFHFVGGAKTDGHNLKSGESLDLFYRVVIHDGGFDRTQTESDASTYAASDVTAAVIDDLAIDESATDELAK